ncbi:putative 2-oxoglutarate-dependent dioxygenase AOP1.2 [Vitis vinifera]|uniref:Fe2OG dioxygenase domain-containing protein n=2 Tax=Vitis vinifera TaxID=29760 RepID=A5AJI0_VITVI|nr:putative 2-oxoglutarate-dependent dioxygenase AOP1.2 [Vitis vinifera]CAN80139.1 hypothetical protein VITISV_028513 [Vitis vinifera]
MGSEAPRLPVLNFSTGTLKPGTRSWLLACKDVLHALEEYGCFVAVYDKVSSELDNTTFCQLEELFDLPTETKVKNTSDKPYFGYIGQHPLIPLHESMGIEDATTLKGVESFTNIMWPAGNDHFCETVLSYSKLVSELEQMVKKMVFESYDAEKYYDSHIQSTTYLLRLIKYRGPQKNETCIGTSCHTDKSFITVLHQNEVCGLEIRTKDGEWISFKPSPSSYVVMAGDALLAWSNGRIHSPEHRVIMNGNKARYSIGLFAYHRGIIEIPEELADEEHPLQFKPFNHYGLLHFYFTNKAGQTESTAKAYCGV